jgi:hypothetical protein
MLIELAMRNCASSTSGAHPIHLSQVITYLKLTDCPAGQLLNFNVPSTKMESDAWTTLINRRISSDQSLLENDAERVG